MPYYYDLTTGACRGYHDGDEPPENAAVAEIDPIDGRQIWSNGVWVWPLDIAKTRRLAEVDARFDVALEAGLSYLGKVLQIRAQDQTNITAMGNEARWAKAAGAGWPVGFAWRMADDSMLALPSADDMIALGEAAKAEVYRLRLVKWAHVDAVWGMATAEAVDAYDIETGWQGA